MKILTLLFLIIWPFSPGKPVDDAIVIVESMRGKDPVVWQETGDQGKASVKYLDAGKYRLVVEFPQQEGKWIKNRRRFRVSTKASYNEKKQTYYYQGGEGYFSVKFSGIKRIDSEDFQAVFRETRKDVEPRYVIAQFQPDRNGAQFSVLIKALTSKQFMKAVDKIENDIFVMSIPRIN